MMISDLHFEVQKTLIFRIGKRHDTNQLAIKIVADLRDSKFCNVVETVMKTLENWHGRHHENQAISNRISSFIDQVKDSSAEV